MLARKEKYNRGLELIINFGYISAIARRRPYEFFIDRVNLEQTMLLEVINIRIKNELATL